MWLDESIRAPQALRPEGTEPDMFILNDAWDSFWVTIGNISVYIRNTGEGVAIDLYPTKHEMEQPLAACYAFYDEADEVIGKG